MIAAKRLWVRFAFMLALFSAACWTLVSAHAGDDTKKPTPGPGKEFTLPQVLDKPAPENVQDLRDIEEHVQKVLKKVMPAVVGVRVGLGSGSGVIVSEDGIILTAGHVSGNPNQNAAVIFPSGKFVKGKTLGRNGSIDSGMMKITEKGKYPFLEVGKSADLKKGQWVIAIGQPGGFRPNRTPVVRVGRVLYVDSRVIRTDCALVGGDSGGPLFDMHGRVIGIHSRIGGTAITENMHVPVDTFLFTWDKLARGESFGGKLGDFTVRSAGGKMVFESKSKLDKDDPTIPCPEDATKKSHFKAFTFKMKAGSTYTIDHISGDKSGKKLDSFLRLQEPDGKLIEEDDDGAGFPHSRIVYSCKTDGERRIIATTFSANQVGDFTVRVFEADPPMGGTIEVYKSMKIPPAAMLPLVEKFAQAKVFLHLNAVLVDDKGATLSNKDVVIRWEKGKDTVKSNGEGIVRWPLVRDKLRKLAIDLPKGVRARLTLTDKEGNTLPLNFGDKDITAESVPSAGGAIIKTVDAKLGKGDPFDFEREKCFRQVHEFKLQAGKTYTLDLVSDDFDTYLRLEDAEKNKLAEDDDGAGNLNSRIVHTAKADAMFRIVVTTCDPGQFGAYRLTIREAGAKEKSK